MKLTALNAISPIDGRYRGKTKSLSAFFSEEALIQYRVRVEIEYFIALCELPLPQLENINHSLFEDLRSIYKHFTEEDAKVSFTNPQSKTLNYPNKISDADFENWIQERGIYFATGAAKEYDKPLLMKDTNENETDGALLIANYGKGKFVYTGLVFFRELPAGVPGAYRLFMNLLDNSPANNP